MDNIQLYHHGTKGMKWGVRRYQNADGSLTSAGRKRYGVKGSKDSKGKKPEQKKHQEETPEQRKARLLKSTDAQELYKNRDLLSTSEINERLTRLDTEKRLGAVAAQSKKGLKYYVDKASELGDTLNKAYQITETPLGKAIKNKLLGKKDEKEAFDLEKAWKNKDKLSSAELADIAKRLTSEDIIRNKMDARAKAKAEADDSAKSGSKSQPDSNTKTSAEKPKSEPKSSGTSAKSTKSSGPEVVTGEWLGKASSSSSSSSNSSSKTSGSKTTYWDVDFTDISTSPSTSRGQSAVAGLLSAPSNSSGSSLGSTPIAGLLGSGSNSSTVSAGRSYVAGLLEAPKDR